MGLELEMAKHPTTDWQQLHRDRLRPFKWYKVLGWNALIRVEKVWMTGGHPGGADAPLYGTMNREE